MSTVDNVACAPGVRLTPPLKWWGGNHYLAKKIIDLMPPHVHYVEPYAGGLAKHVPRTVSCACACHQRYDNEGLHT